MTITYISLLQYAHIDESFSSRDSQQWEQIVMHGEAEALVYAILCQGIMPLQGTLVSQHLMFSIRKGILTNNLNIA